MSISYLETHVYSDPVGDITYYRLTPQHESQKHLLIVWCIHGDETSGYWWIRNFMEWLKQVSVQTTLTIIPICNSYGYTNCTRYDQTGQDPNRIWTPVLSTSQHLHRFWLTDILPSNPTHLLTIHEDDEQDSIYAYAYLQDAEKPGFQQARASLSQKYPIYREHKLYGTPISQWLITEPSHDQSLEDTMFSYFQMNTVNLEVPDCRGVEENAKTIGDFCHIRYTALEQRNE